LIAFQPPDSETVS